MAQLTNNFTLFLLVLSFLAPNAKAENDKFDLSQWAIQETDDRGESMMQELPPDLLVCNYFSKFQQKLKEITVIFRITEIATTIIRIIQIIRKLGLPHHAPPEIPKDQCKLPGYRRIRVELSPSGEILKAPLRSRTNIQIHFKQPPEDSDQSPLNSRASLANQR